MLAFLVIVSGSFALGTASSQELSIQGEPATNLEIISGILQNAGEELRTLTEADSLLPVVVSVDAETDQWFITHAIIAALQPELRKVYSRADSVHGPFIDITLHVLALGVDYGDERRNRSSGRNEVGRTVRTDIRYLVVRNPSKFILADKTFSRTCRDVIDESAITLMENPRIRCTQSANRRDSMLDKMVEPFFIIGATGLAVYLLFHVRS